MLHRKKRQEMGNIKSGVLLVTLELGTQFSLSFKGSFAAFIEGLLKRLLYASSPK